MVNSVIYPFYHKQVYQLKMNKYVNKSLKHLSQTQTQSQWNDK